MKQFLFTLLILLNFLIGSLSLIQCGVRKVAINHVIVNGHNTFPGQWPWHVAIYHRSGVSESYACGGTLVNQFYVLTADHCVKGDNGFVLLPRRIFVRVGVHNLQEPDPETFPQHRVQHIHEFEVSSNLKNDIALLELSTKVLFTNYFQPVCLNEVKDLTNQFGTAIGWGVTEHDEESVILKSSQMPVISTVRCLESNDGIFRQVLDSSVICAGYLNGTTVCNGDSGGGLHFERNGVWFIGGITSFTAQRDSSNKCHTKSYAGFTNVQMFISWIKSVTGIQYRYLKISLKTPILPRNCGRHLVNRITRGSNADLGEFPWMAAIIRKYDEGRFMICTLGSLIHKRYVLTQAKFEDFVFVRLGEYDLRDKECQSVYETGCGPPVLDVFIESTIIHPEFNNQTLQNSITLIRLAKDVIFTDYIQPVCLPTSTMAVPEYFATGWGLAVSGGKYFEILQKATVPAIDRSECEMKMRKENLSYYVGEGIICAGTVGSPNTFHGDYGGPLGYPVRYHQKSVRFVQFGITSIVRCGNGPSVYTDVAYYMGWILANIKP